MNTKFDVEFCGDSREAMFFSVKTARGIDYSFFISDMETSIRFYVQREDYGIILRVAELSLSHIISFFDSGIEDPYSIDNRIPLITEFLQTQYTQAYIDNYNEIVDRAINR